MSFILEKPQAKFNVLFNGWLENYLAECSKNSYHYPTLLESQKYSLTSGGKRFRPFVSYLVHEMFAGDSKNLRTLCLAIEMIHTYSLIHDDLPCMDNDDLRRGKPTNHKVYGEAMALLAGDGLLSDVFYLLSSDSELSYEVRIKLISMLSIQIGSFGMVSGQAQDMAANKDVKLETLKTIHNLKTANLIEAAAVGAALVAEVSDEELHLVMEFSHCLGMSFQIKDDILDANDKDQDHKSYVTLLGLEKTQAELKRYSDRAVAALQNLAKYNKKTTYLEEMIKMNLQREA
jgi:geranylgeranyl diphosphate synthase, type II